MLASLLRIILLTATLKILERGLDKGPIIGIKYVQSLKGDIVIKEFRLSGVMAWDYMGFSTITTDKISPQQNEELTAAVCKLIKEAELYVQGKRAQMQLFRDRFVRDADKEEMEEG